MADPVQFIEITDFSPGIHASLYSSLSARATADPTIKGNMIGKGYARANGTERCRADKFGALEPLPLNQTFIGRFPEGGWVEFPGTTGNYLSTPDAAALDITGQITIIVKATLDDWSPGVDVAFVSKWNPTGNQRSYWFGVDGSSAIIPQLLFQYTGDGAAPSTGERVESTLLTLDPFSTHWFAVTCDPDVAAGNGIVKFFTSMDGVAWTQIGFDVSLGGSDDNAIFSSTAALLLGADGAGSTANMTGNLHYVSVINEYRPTSPIEGTVAPAFTFEGPLDLRDVNDGAANFTVQTGQTVTVNYSGSPNTDIVTSSPGAIPPVVPNLQADTHTPAALRGVYLLDVGLLAHAAPNGGIATSTEPFDPFGGSLYTVWGYWWDAAGASEYKAFVHGREFRLWTDPSNTAPTFMLDFLFQRTEEEHPSTALYEILLPSASLVPGRFYYGYTTPGLVEAGDDTVFRSEWFYPVMSVIAGTPMYWLRQSAHWRHTTIPTNEAGQLMHVYNAAGAIVDPFGHYTPSIGVTYGNTIIGMSFNNDDVGAGNIQPLPTVGNIHQWYFRRGERDYALDITDFTPDQRAGGPWCPVLAVTHQGRLVIADRRQTERTFGIRNSAGTATVIRSQDDLLFYSDAYLPMQNFVDPAITPVAGIANAALGNYPAATHEKYNKLVVADDAVAPIGAFGTVAIDQLLVVKHYGGGALIQGDVNNPTIRRLPFIEPTRGVTVNGCATPLGYVYGSTDGIFAWKGGDVSEKLSPQLDGFFWNHVLETRTTLTGGTVVPEIYSGARGRFAFWNGLVCVPNNYLLDTETGGWWRWGSSSRVESQTVDMAPYNIYLALGSALPWSVGGQPGRLIAFPYRNTGNYNEASEYEPWFQIFDPDLYDNNYSWQSHPLIESLGRQLTYQEVRLVATCQSSITSSVDVTVEAFDQSGGLVGTQVATFSLDTGTREPQMMFKDIMNLTGEYITIKINARTNLPGNPAPKVHSVAIGYREHRKSIRNG